MNISGFISFLLLVPLPPFYAGSLLLGITHGVFSLPVVLFSDGDPPQGSGFSSLQDFFPAGKTFAELNTQLPIVSPPPKEEALSPPAPPLSLRLSKTFPFPHSV